MESRSDESISNRGGNKTAMRPFTKLLWTLVIITVIIIIIIIVVAHLVVERYFGYVGYDTIRYDTVE